MAEGDVGWWGLAASLVLIVITLGISLWRRLGLESDVAVAVVRARAAGGDASRSAPRRPA